MTRFSAEVSWQYKGPDFLGNKYSRAHQWHFDGGISVPASASPEIVAPPWSEAGNVDPEEAFVVSLASCHMLFFLSLAARDGYIVLSYRDQASGILEKNAAGKMVISQVTLHPQCEFDPNTSPDRLCLQNLHHRAHELCFIANSVKTDVRVELDQADRQSTDSLGSPY